MSSEKFTDFFDTVKEKSRNQNEFFGSTGLETEDYIPESSNEVSQLEAGLAGIASGLINTRGCCIIRSRTY